VVGCFDEVHRLPAALAHRHAFVKTQYRIGLSSTPDLRCDGRGVFVSKMTGALVGDDWGEQMRSGIVKRIPVKVLLVENREHKHQVVGELLRQHESVVVLCEAIEDGRSWSCVTASRSSTARQARCACCAAPRAWCCRAWAMPASACRTARSLWIIRASSDRASRACSGWAA
jgi:hypothetical protein